MPTEDEYNPNLGWGDEGDLRDPAPDATVYNPALGWGDEGQNDSPNPNPDPDPSLENLALQDGYATGDPGNSRSSRDAMSDPSNSMLQKLFNSVGMGGIGKSLTTAGRGIDSIGNWMEANRQLTSMIASGIGNAQKLSAMREAAALTRQHVLDDRQAYGNSITKAAYPTGGIVNGAMGALANKYGPRA